MFLGPKMIVPYLILIVFGGPLLRTIPWGIVWQGACTETIPQEIVGDSDRHETIKNVIVHVANRLFFDDFD